MVPVMRLFCAKSAAGASRSARIVQVFIRDFSLSLENGAEGGESPSKQ
jgi:hypothetical protein